MNYTARQAFYNSNQVLNNFEAVYVHISFMCMESIRRYSEFHYNNCTYTIPMYIMGFAIYDFQQIKRRLKKHLRDLEYKVKTSKVSPNIICISWSHIAKTIAPDGSVRA